jgi:hypothetical protein
MGKALRERVGEQWDAVGLEKARHALLGEVALAVLPLVVLLLDHCGLQGTLAAPQTPARAAAAGGG